VSRPYAQLRQLARERGLKGFPKLKKAEMVDVLERTDSAEPSPETPPALRGTPPPATEEVTGDGDRNGDGGATFDDEVRAWGAAGDEVHRVPSDGSRPREFEPQNR
jgi:hypothetical protein